jgi:CBS domain containing-hemolysin-like protein
MNSGFLALSVIHTHAKRYYVCKHCKHTFLGVCSKCRKILGELAHNESEDILRITELTLVSKSSTRHRLLCTMQATYTEKHFK